MKIKYCNKFSKRLYVISNNNLEDDDNWDDNFKKLLFDKINESKNSNKKYIGIDINSFVTDNNNCYYIYNTIIEYLNVLSSKIDFSKIKFYFKKLNNKGSKTKNKELKDSFVRYLKNKDSSKKSKEYVVYLDKKIEPTKDEEETRKRLEARLQIKHDDKKEQEKEKLKREIEEEVERLRKELEESSHMQCNGPFEHSEVITHIGSNIDSGNIDKKFKEYLKNTPKTTFQSCLNYFIIKKVPPFMSLSTIYKPVGVSRSVFSRIQKENVIPTKETIAALTIGFKLNIKEAEEFYESAGYSLTKTFFLDKVIRFFIENNNYDIYEINSLLQDYNYPILGAKISDNKKSKDKEESQK